MKLYHIIGLSTAALLSLGALGLMTQAESIEYNTDYRIETLSGDISYLDNIQLFQKNPLMSSFFVSG